MHKFGGRAWLTPTASAKWRPFRVRRPARLAVVLSACKGVTDALLRLVALAERQDGGYRSELAQLRSRHAAIAQEVLTAPAAQAYLTGFDRDARICWASCTRWS